MPGAAEPAATFLQPAARVLVVEDEPQTRKAISDLLRSRGYGVTEAADGVEALESLRDGGPLPQLVLLDLGMPVMDGWRCFRAIRNDPALARIPVVVVTAGDEAAAPTPEDRFLRKPFTTEELFGMVRAALSGGRRAP